MTEPSIGDKSSGEVDAGHLKAFIERIERLEEEKKALSDDIKDVYGEAKANGFDVKIMRKVVSLRKIDRDKRIEEEVILDAYLGALGMLSDTPLGVAAVRRTFGNPVPLTDDEKAKGYVGAFVDKKGMRVAMGVKV